MITADGAAAPLLRLTDVTLRFGGLQALHNVSFDVLPGELLAVIGPNGAGKTTVFNCINGIYRPQEGSITFEGTELIGRRPSAIARLGVGRTFQALALLNELDVMENLMVGRHLAMRSGLLSAAVWVGRARREEHANIARCRELAEFLGVSDHLETPVGELPLSLQKRVEIGRALATEPKLLLLDEPVAGMSPTETDEIDELVRDIQRRLGIAVMLVEHNMHLVMGLAERIVALNFGEVLATGTPDEVATHPDVVSSYLGTPEAT